MRKLIVCSIVSLSLLLGMRGMVVNCLASKAAPSQAEALSALQFPIPSSTQARQYLGLSGSGKFRLDQIPGDLLILEVFSVYCPYCQKEAPRVDALYRAIAEHPGLPGRVKLVGIGVGNSRYEVELFKIRFKIPFVLLPDPKFTVGNVLKGFRTPDFIVLKRNGSAPPTIIYSKAGEFGNPQHFLDSLLHKAGMKG